MWILSTRYEYSVSLKVSAVKALVMWNLIYSLFAGEMSKETEARWTWITSWAIVRRGVPRSLGESTAGGSIMVRSEPLSSSRSVRHFAE